MKKITNLAMILMLAGLSSGTAMAKDIYVSATGDDNNDGLSAATPVKTLTRVNDFIEMEDVIHISGLLDMRNEVPADFDPSKGLGAGELAAAGGRWVSHDNGKKIGFNICGRDGNLWQGLTFIGEDPENDGFNGNDEVGFFIIRGQNRGGTKFINLSFQNGVANPDGGTIYAKDEAVLTFDNCVFRNCHPDWANFTLDGNAYKAKGNDNRGGAIRIEANTVATITDCLFENNINCYGGGIMITGTTRSKDGFDNHTGGVNIYNTRFLNNSAYGCVDGDENNYVDGTNGGAICVWSLNQSAYVNIDHCLFDGNKTFNNGGAIYLFDNVAYGHYQDVTISNCAFYNNYSERGGALEIKNNGGMPEPKGYTKNIRCKILNTTMAYNTAKNDGGAILLWGGCTGDSSYPQDELTMVNCTIYGNQTMGNAGHGAGYKEMKDDNYGNTDLVNRNFYNCIFENNIAPSAGDTGEYSDFTTALIGLNMANCYMGRPVIIGGTSVEDFMGTLNNGDGAINIIHTYTGEKIGDEGIFMLASDDVAPNVYDYSGNMVPFIPLPDGSDLINAGDVNYLTREESTITTSDKNATLPVLGFDITKADQLGFARQSGKCSIGAAEAPVSTIVNDGYLEGKELPYISGEEGGSSLIESISADAGLNVTREGNVFKAEGCQLAVFSISGQLVANGNNLVNADNLEKGIYIIKVTNKTETRSIKVIR